MANKLFLYSFLLSIFIVIISGKKFEDEKEKPAWAKKDIRDYNEADLERLLDQWEVKYNMIISQDNRPVAVEL